MSWRKVSQRFWQWKSIKYLIIIQPKSQNPCAFLEFWIYLFGSKFRGKQCKTLNGLNVYWILDHLHKVLTAKSRKMYPCYSHLEVTLQGDGQRCSWEVQARLWGQLGPAICQLAVLAVTPSLRIQGPGLFFGLPRLEARKGRNSLEKSSPVTHSLIPHEETNSLRSTRFFLIVLKSAQRDTSEQKRKNKKPWFSKVTL